MATASTTNERTTEMPDPNHEIKSARKSAQTLKQAATGKTTGETAGTKSAAKAAAKDAAADVESAALDIKATAKTAASSVASTAARVVPLAKDDVLARIETLRAELGELTSTLKAQGTAVLDEKTREIRQVAAQKTAVAKETYTELAADTEAKIRANPLTSVAIAAGVGLLLGAISRR